MTYIPYQVNREIEKIVSDIMDKGCHVLKTDKHIGCWVYCNQEELDEKMNDINNALKDYEDKYSIYVLTESSNAR